MKVKEIKQFEETIAHKLYLLDTKKHAENMREYSFKDETPNEFSVDDFLYTRCAVIARGQDNYVEILQNPEKMLNKG